jgi:class 3 adenylate cyclase
MEPQIRYVRSADGVRIAYATTGSGGMPIICAPNSDGLVSVDVEWRIGRIREGIERISQAHTLIRVEARGRGYSDREIHDGSFAAQVGDLAAAIDAIDAPKIHLVGGTGGALSSRLCLAYAAENLHRLKTLTLFGAAVGVPGVISPIRRAIYKLSEFDFDFYKKALALHAFDWEDGKIIADAIAGLTPEELAFGQQASREVADLGHLLPEVKCPVLVCHMRASSFDLVSMNESRRLASELPQAVLRVVDVNLPSAFDVDGTGVDALLSFVDEHEGVTSAHEPSGTAIILFTDIADSTTLTESMGDAAFRHHARALDGTLRTIITTNGGTPIYGKLLGDGVLATFPAASQAIAAARACEAACSGTPLKLHLGIHAGDVIRESNNVFGGAVNIASRICALSAPGEILVSATVRDLARTSAAVAFDDRGDHTLKGIADPVHLFAVRGERP